MGIGLGWWRGSGCEIAQMGPGDRGGWTGRIGREDQLIVADHESVALIEGAGLMNLCAVYEGAIAASQVNHGVTTAIITQEGMAARSQLVAFEDDIAGWRAAHRHGTSVQHVLACGGGTR